MTRNRWQWVLVLGLLVTTAVCYFRPSPTPLRSGLDPAAAQRARAASLERLERLESERRTAAEMVLVDPWPYIRVERCAHVPVRRLRCITSGGVVSSFSLTAYAYKQGSPVVVPGGRVVHYDGKELTLELPPDADYVRLHQNGH